MVDRIGICPAHTPCQIRLVLELFLGLASSHLQKKNDGKKSLLTQPTKLSNQRKYVLYEHSISALSVPGA